MTDFDINFGPWIDYGNSDKENEIKIKMEELASAKWSPFNGYDFAQIFIFCMSYAFSKGRAPKPPPKRKGSMPASAFKRDMRDFMKVVAIANTGDLEVITDPNKVVRICEDYAYAGFLEVYDMIKNRDPTIPNEMIIDSILQNVEESRSKN